VSVFDPERMMRLLDATGVAYILIGGLANNLHGYERVTTDMDICYERSRENVERLAGILRQLDARPREWPADVPFVLDTQTILNGDAFTFSTLAGDLDCIGTPAGSGGFEDLSAGAVAYDLGPGLIVRVVGIDDLIRIKRAAGRRTDLSDVEALEELRTLRAEDYGPS
jgi:hypothetical protein